MITYNHEEYLAEAISGVLTQICDFDVELIIADDCSPDRTIEVVDTFKSHRNYHWIKYTRHPKNKGVMANFVWALKQASGKYIALCEGDDYWTDPLKLDKQLDYLIRNPEYSITTSNCLILEDNRTCEYKFPYNGFNGLSRKRQYSRFLLSQNWIPVMNILFENRNSIIENIQTIPTNLYGDFQIVYNNLKFGKLYYSDQIAGVYRVHDKGISRNSTEIENRNFERAVMHYKLKKALGEFFIYTTIKIFVHNFCINYKPLFGYRLRKKVLKWSSK
jgi:glycosyltransferase involved in cell wall biosynthesis